MKHLIFIFEVIWYVSTVLGWISLTYHNDINFYQNTILGTLVFIAFQVWRIKKEN